MTKSKSIAFIVMMSLLFGFKKQETIVYLIGDSTISIKDVKAYPETGWGMPFANFFDHEVKVANHAKNGRSTSSFLKENRWQPIVDALKTGDYVFIQFGHNDEVPTKATYTNEGDYVMYLTKYIKETQAKGAFPVLITPVTRRSFDANGKLEDSHKVYAQLVRDLAKKLNVPLIDLTKASMDMVQELGVEASIKLYNHLAPGAHANYPNGKKDDTHFSALGAQKVAELVLQGVKDLKLPLANHILEK